MNEHPPDDELASAALDGEATPAELARLGADPALAERRATFAHLAELVGGDVGPPDPAARDRAVAAALATPIPAARPERPAARSRRSPVPWLAAAAIALVVLVPAALLATGSLTGTRGQGDRTASAPQAEDATTEGAPGEATASLAGPGPITEADSGSGQDQATAGGSGGGEVADLGPVADLPALAAALGPLLAEPAAAPGPGQGQADGGGAPPAAAPAPPCDPATGDDLLRARVDYQGTPALVVVDEVPGTGAVATVYDQAGCAVLGQVGV